MKFLSALIFFSCASIYPAAQESQSKTIENQQQLTASIKVPQVRKSGLHALVATQITVSALQDIISGYVGSFDCTFMGKINAQVIPISTHPSTHNSFDHFLHIDEERNCLKSVVIGQNDKKCLKKWDLLTGQEMSSCFVIESKWAPNDIFSNHFTSDGKYIAGVQNDEAVNGKLEGISCKKDENNNMKFEINPLYTSDDIKIQILPANRQISCLSDDGKFQFNLFFGDEAFSIINLQNNAGIGLEKSQFLAEQGNITQAYRISALALSSRSMAAFLVTPPIGSSFGMFNNSEEAPNDREKAYVAIYYGQVGKKRIVEIPGDYFDSLDSNPQLRFTLDNEYLEIRAKNKWIYWQINIATGAIEQKQDRFGGKFNTYSLDGTYRALVIDDKVAIINTKSNTCKIIHILDNGQIEQLALSKTGKYLAIAIRDREGFNQGIYVFKTLDLTNPGSEDNTQSDSDWEYNLLKNSLIKAASEETNLANHLDCIASYASIKPIISAEYEITDNGIKAVQEELTKNKKKIFPVKKENIIPDEYGFGPGASDCSISEYF